MVPKKKRTSYKINTYLLTQSIQMNLHSISIQLARQQKHTLQYAVMIVLYC